MLKVGYVRGTQFGIVKTSRWSAHELPFDSLGTPGKKEQYERSRKLFEEEFVRLDSTPVPRRAHMRGKPA